MSATHRARQRVDLADIVAELTRPHTNRERYEVRGRGRSTRSRYNQVRVPSLLHQLEHAVPQTNRDARSTAGYESRPTAHLEALDTFIQIDHDVRVMLKQLHARTDGSAADCVRRLHGTAPRDKAVARELRRWYAQARVVTGWDSPAWRPDNTCPMCDAHGTLRVKWHDEYALCVDCRETWDDTTIGLLADHIRWESAIRETRYRPPVTPCFCPLPMPEVVNLRLCPNCGSARCIRALQQPYGRVPDDGPDEP